MYFKEAWEKLYELHVRLQTCTYDNWDEFNKDLQELTTNPFPFVDPDTLSKEEFKARGDEMSRYLEARGEILKIGMFVLIGYKPNLEKKLLKV